MPPPDTIPGRRLFFWIGQAAKQLREEADAAPEAIATLAKTRRETVDRFEKGQHRPREFERMLAAYGECLGLNDPRDIVVQGVRMWFEHGEPPTLNGDGNDP